MSTLSDALSALKNVVLMQERLDVLQRTMDRLAADVKGLDGYIGEVDKRVIRIETMIEMSGRDRSPPRLEG